MTRDWIVGYDGSPSAGHTADWASSQAHGRDVRLKLVSAWEVPFLAKLSGIRMASGVDRAGIEATANHQLDTEIARLRELDLEVAGEAVEGDARSILVGESPQADLIIVGQRGHDGTGPMHLGSVSRHCATHSEVPTIVVPEDSGTAPVTRVAVGFDGSPESQAALRWTLFWNGPEVFIEVVRAFEVINWMSPSATIERFEPEVTEARAAFEDEVRAIDEAGRCVLRFEVGDAREVLDAVAGEVDLLVLGTRGAGRFTSTLLGSVAAHMAHHAQTPIAIVPS